MTLDVSLRNTHAGAFQFAGSIVFTLDSQLAITSFTNNAKDWVIKLTGRKPAKGLPLKELLQEQMQAEEMESLLRKALQQQSQTFTILESKTKVHHTYGLRINPLQEEGVLVQVTPISATSPDGEELSPKTQTALPLIATVPIIADLLPLPIIVAYPDKMELKYVNQQFADLFDYSRDALYRMNLLELFAYPEDRRKLYNRLNQSRVVSGIALKGRKKSGEVFDALVSTQVIKTGCRWLLIAAIHNISGQKKVEQQLKTAISQAKEADELKNEFIANISHEVRTPLNTILGFTELLKSRLENIGDYHEYLDGIYKSGQNLSGLIKDILDISRIESGNIEIREKKTDLKQLIADINEFYLLKARQKNLEILSEVDPQIPAYLKIDHKRLRQILINLTGNAIKFTEEGFVRITAELKAYKKQENKANICITVEDTGIGIQEEKQKRIFTPFPQLLKEGRFTEQESGLGLAITKRLVEAMGGRIHLESAVGKGSAFRIDLQDVPIEWRQYSQTKDAIQHMPEFQKNTIYIADDMKSSRKIMANYLRDTNLEIIEAKNGQELLRMLKNDMPGAILLDIYMPDMHGYQVATKIKRTPRFQHIPLIGITISHSNLQKTNSFDEILLKPVGKEKLLNILSKYLPTPEESEQQQTDSHTLSSNTDDRLKEARKNDKAYIEEKIAGFKHYHKRIRSHLAMHEAEDFARELSDFANSCGFSELQKSAETLLKAAINFDIDAVLRINDEIEANWPEE